MVKVYEDVGDNVIELVEKAARKIATALGGLSEKKYGKTSERKREQEQHIEGLETVYKDNDANSRRSSYVPHCTSTGTLLWLLALQYDNITICITS